MKKYEIAQLVIAQIVEHSRRQGISKIELAKLAKRLQETDGPELYAEWKAINAKAADTFRRLKLPAQLQDPKELEMLVRVYHPKIQDDD